MGGRQTHEARKAFAEVRQLIVVGLAGARRQSLDLEKLGGVLAPEFLNEPAFSDATPADTHGESSLFASPKCIEFRQRCAATHELEVAFRL